MEHPEWALKYRIKGTELRNIRGRYYLYNITSRRDPETKKVKKVTLNQVGTISEEYGLIPTGMKRKGKIPKGASPFKEEVKLDNNFTDAFEGKIEDTRTTKNLMYSMSELLFLAISAIICGAEGWNDMEIFGKTHIDYLRRYFDYKQGAPSSSTICRFFRNLDPDKFAMLFREWITNLASAVGAKVIAIDGKSSRHSYNRDKKGEETQMLHTVSAFASEARIVLAQEKVSQKSNEITAIPKLIEWLDIKRKIVTIDAIGCQHSIAKQIIDKEGDYIFALKGNQGNLSKDVGEAFNSQTYPSKSYTDYDKGHGRIETRVCTIINEVEHLKAAHSKWSSIKSIIKIDSTREIKGNKTFETRYYISSLHIEADKMLQAIRSHWGIENSLHWVLDMSFNEDCSRIRKDNAPQIAAILRHISINLLQHFKTQKTGFENASIKALRKICGWNTKYLDLVISSKKTS